LEENIVPQAISDNIDCPAQDVDSTAKELRLKTSSANKRGSAQTVTGGQTGPLGAAARENDPRTAELTTYSEAVAGSGQLLSQRRTAPQPRAEGADRRTEERWLVRTGRG
jgi:hypothetical protein